MIARGLTALIFLSVTAFGIVPVHAQDPAPVESGDTGDTGDAEAPEKAPVPSRFGAAPTDEAYGAYQRGLYITARNLALPRAEAGDAAAQTLLGEIYSRGLGVPRDLEEAAKWYEAAALQGEPEAQLQYALELLRRADPDARSQARELMQASADAGNSKAQFNFAQMLLTDQPGASGQRAAWPYFLKAAENNVPDAQYAVAQYYISGSADVIPDAGQARGWLLRAARNGYDTAQLELGGFLLRGEGGDRNLEAAFGWTRRAAVQGNVVAQAELAKLYRAGIGVEPDTTLAAAWYVLSRRAGYRDRLLDDFWEGLSAETQKSAIEQANRLR